MTERQYNDLKAEIDGKIATLSDECSTLTAEVREHFKNSEYEKMSEKTELFIAKNDEILDLLREKENLRKDIRTNGFDEEDYDQLDDLYDLPDEELVHTEEPTQEPAQEEQEQQADTADRFHHIKDLFGVYPTIEKHIIFPPCDTEVVQFLMGYIEALHDTGNLVHDYYCDVLDELQQYEQYIEYGGTENA